MIFILSFFREFELKAFINGLLIAGAALLTGCASAPQVPVGMGADALNAGAGKIGVAMTELPKVDTAFPGANCLLCIGVANANHSTLNKHVQSLGHEDLPGLKKMAADLIAKKGAGSKVIDVPIKIADLPKFPGDAPNFARKDFRGLASTYGVDKLLVVEIGALGVWRDYAAYIPTAEPKAVFKGVAYMVNLKTNAYEWYSPIDINKAATVWDQPPKFPDLTNAYFQAIELGKDAVLKPLQ